jgi:hypothetical protein
MRILPVLFVAAISTASPAAAHAQGAIIQSLEDLQDRPEPPGFRGVLPAQVDLAATVPTPRAQGRAGSCASFAATYAVASQALRRAGLGPTLELSPAFTYNSLSRDPYCRVGLATAQVLDQLRNVGALPLEEFAYDSGWCGRLPTEAELQRAAKYRIKGWSKFDARNVEAVKAQLARGVPVIFDLMMNDELVALKGDAIFDGPVAKSGPGHAMAAIGYDDSRKAFRIENSWGRAWADGGYGWLSYDFWTASVHVGYVID